MKCLNCGAEISSELQKCPYCDCEVIQEEKTQPQTTITNNYFGGAPKQEETKTACPRCGSNRIQFKREEVGSEKNKKTKQVMYRTVGICQDCGNTWNANSVAEKKKHGVWFWILAVLFLPVSLCVWFYKTDRVKLDKKIRLAIIAAFWVLILIIGAVSPDAEEPAASGSADATAAVQVIEADDAQSADESADAQDDAEDAAAAATTTKKETTTAAPTTTKASVSLGKLNALASAKNYLDFSAFSAKGLKEQLEYEGYSADEAAYGVDNCGADWNEQAAKKAQDYLDFSSFSRDGLIEQLEFEGFTHEQALYGVSAVGY